MDAGAAKAIVLAPYGFVRSKRSKPSMTQVVRLILKPAVCSNGCGLYYVAPDVKHDDPSNACPTCQGTAKAWKLGELEEVEFTVHTVLGNVVDLTFLRSIGPVRRRSLVHQTSTALVTPQALAP